MNGEADSPPTSGGALLQAAVPLMIVQVKVEKGATVLSSAQIQEGK
jgi:hypothetical protein